MRNKINIFMLNLYLALGTWLIYKAKDINGHAERVHGFREVLEDLELPPKLVQILALEMLDGNRVHIRVS